MRHLVVIAAAAALLAAASAAAGTAPAPRSAVAAAAQQVVASGVPGVVVLARDGRRTTIVARGVANRRTGEPVTPATRFRIGTMTMTFVATAVLQLVEEGKLSLDEPADRAFPGLLPARWRITVRQLLQHTSNLYDYTQDARWFLPYRGGHDDYRWTPRRLLALSTGRPRQVQPPNVRLNGSYADYIALGLIVEHVTHRSIGDVLARRIFRPLGLRSTSFDTRPVTGRGIARGYASSSYVDASRQNASWAWAAGGIVSNARDVASFFRQLLGGDVLRPATLQAMHATIPFQATTHDSYGLGLWRSGSLWIQAHTTWRCDTTVWGQNGDSTGYFGLAWASRSGDRQFVILTNGARGFAFGVPGVWTYTTGSAIAELAARAYCG